ncbi:TraB/GumN family protein [Methylopila sp. Yamaguchi]|uniref:TraB/GumN family protein n=1 Tax=Methylopila sp. Yamaguchi TaxID=1437817 RepID=UPI000CB4F72F|nr:TraB/GumN family protein [Methylopila sp. Yamaguchi]GBD48780.1 GumN family protein [Methylopila sp. Yamaguchi]
MRRAASRLAKRLCAALAASLFGLAAAAAAPLACQGTDLVGKIRDEDPAAFARFEAAGRKTRDAEGLLWRVEKEGAAPSHLFGTIHLSDERLKPLAAPVTAALASASLVLIEPREIADPQAAAMAREVAGRRAVRPGGDALFRVPAGDRLAVINLLAARGVPENTAQKLEPWFLAMLAAAPSCEIARIDEGMLNVDQLVVEAARAKGIGVEGLEDVDEQMATLAAVPEALAVRVLVDAARLGPGFADWIETMVNLYRDRRMGFLAAAVRDADLGGPRMRTQYDYLEALLGERNARMHERSRSAFAAGGAFMAVGALHLAGDDGLVERLRRDGYRVTRAW